MTADDAADRLLRAFARHRGAMERSIARRVGGCRATAADLVQDLFLRLWRRPPGTPELTGGYLLRSARNIATDHLRAVSARPDTNAAPPEEPVSDHPSADRVLEAGEEAAILRATLRALPERTRQAFLLNRARGLSYAQIARLQGVSVSTVEKDMMRALAACRAALPER